MATVERPTSTGAAFNRFYNLRRNNVARILIRNGYLTWKQVAEASDADLLALRGIGKAALEDIRREQWLENL